MPMVMVGHVEALVRAHALVEGFSGARSELKLAHDPVKSWMSPVAFPILLASVSPAKLGLMATDQA